MPEYSLPTGISTHLTLTRPTTKPYRDRPIGPTRPLAAVKRKADVSGCLALRAWRCLVPCLRGAHSPNPPGILCAPLFAAKCRVNPPVYSVDRGRRYVDSFRKPAAGYDGRRESDACPPHQRRRRRALANYRWKNMHALNDECGPLPDWEREKRTPLPGT